MQLTLTAPHPGILLKSYLEATDTKPEVLARRIGCKAYKIREICAERYGVSPKMALQLSHALDTTPFLWMTAQNNWDLRQAMISLGTMPSDYKPKMHLGAPIDAFISPMHG